MKKNNTHIKQMELVDKILPELMKLSDIFSEEKSNIKICVNGGYFTYISDEEQQIQDNMPNQIRQDIWNELNELIDEKRTKKLCDKFELAWGERYCKICGYSPEKLIKFIKEKINL